MVIKITKNKNGHNSDFNEETVLRHVIDEYNRMQADTVQPRISKFRPSFLESHACIFLK